MIAVMIILSSNVLFVRDITRNLTVRQKFIKEVKMLFVSIVINRIRNQIIRENGQKN